MKGIQIATNMIVVIAIAVIAIVTLGIFFTSNSLRTVSDINNQQVFSGACVQYCKSGTYETYLALYDAMQDDAEFVQACVNMKLIPEGSISLQNCLKECPNCNIEWQNFDTMVGDRNNDRLAAIINRG